MDMQRHLGLGWALFFDGLTRSCSRIINGLGRNLVDREASIGRNLEKLTQNPSAVRIADTNCRIAVEECGKRRVTTEKMSATTK